MNKSALIVILQADFFVCYSFIVTLDLYAETFESSVAGCSSALKTCLSLQFDLYANNIDNINIKKLPHS